MANTPDHVHIQFKFDEADTAILKTSLPCSVHQTHIPYTHVNEIHHVWPLGHGGPDTKENKTVICATGHNSVHRLMDILLKWVKDHPEADGKKIPPELYEGFSLGERKLARTGVDRILRQAM